MEENKHNIYTLGDVFKVGFSRWIKGWKPIHLCWLFEKYGYPVPKYLIGGANKAPELCGSRISDDVRAWEADEDLDVTAWVVGDAFCVSIAFGAPAGANSGARNLRIRWRNVTDGGSFADLDNTGELRYDGVTDLVNDNDLTEAESGCTPNAQTTYVTGKERESANDFTYTALVDGEWTACMWAVSSSNALGSKKYAFELYNVTDAGSVGTCLAEITMEAGAVSDDLATKQLMINGFKPIMIRGG